MCSLFYQAATEEDGDAAPQQHTFHQQLSTAVNAIYNGARAPHTLPRPLTLPLLSLAPHPGLSPDPLTPHPSPPSPRPARGHPGRDPVAL